MTWHPNVKEYLSENNYQPIIDFYEQLLEENPENINDYFYLGLAYLLAGKEEEAQTTWFLAIAEDDSLQGQLIAILAEEAVRLEDSDQKVSAWLIRNHWREIEPDNINNLLKLILLDIELESYKPEVLELWRVVEVLKETPQETISDEFLTKILEKTLEFPHQGTVELAKVILNKVNNPLELAEIIIQKTKQLSVNNLMLEYAADLTKIYLGYYPEKDNIALKLFWDLHNIKRYDEALEIANIYQDKADDLIAEVLWKYCFICVYQGKGNWLGIQKLIPEIKNLLSEIIKQGLKIEKPHIANSFNIIAYSFNYLQDNPKENHYLQQKIAQLFYDYHKNEQEVLPSKKKDQSPRKLKIGYIASTLGKHSVGWLSRWLFQHHNREEFEIFIYCLKRKENPFTNYWFGEQSDHLYFCNNNITSILEQIKKDDIDILVELDSVTYNLTAVVMCKKPAPIQVTWLGADASGLPSIDYYIADHLVVLENAQEYYSEKIWRLPETYLAVDGFEITIPSISKQSLGIPQDSVIYFNVQNGLKLHPDILKIQMEIVKAVPNSYYMIKAGGDRKIMEKSIFDLATQVGLNEDKIIIIDLAKDEPTHRANLQVADVVLDTYPYNGATTTLETLWVGTPMVTKVGEQFYARNSYAFMMNAGITEGIAWNDQEYFDWGVRLGQDANLRKEISWKLKQSRQTSPLWNAEKFTREMEKAYRQMWEIYCQK